MLQDALDSLSDIFSTPFRGVMLKSVALTVAVLALGGVALGHFVIGFVTVSTAWLAAVLSLAIGLGVIAALVLLAAPTTSLVASFFFDEIAALVEHEVDPTGPTGRAAPLWDSTLAALRFAALTLGVMLAALVLLFVPGFGFAAWFAANAYLLGREYFELAAMRHISAAEARDLFDRHWLEVFAAGAIVATLVAVPVLNLLTPLYATAFLTRVFRRIA